MQIDPSDRAQGTISLRGVARRMREPSGARVPLAFGRYSPPAKLAPARPLLTPKEVSEGSSRWSSALLKIMPPFSSWMPPEAVVQAAAAQPEQQQLLGSSAQYSFPDGLPKVCSCASQPCRLYQPAILSSASHSKMVSRSRHCSPILDLMLMTSV